MVYPLIQSVFLIAALFQIGWVVLPAHASADIRPSSLTVQFAGEPTQFDPLMMEDGLALRLAANVIATPTEFDSEGHLRNALLESAVVNKNATQFQFKFKEQLVWSDGVAFHADQFLLALKRLSSAKVKVALSELFPSIDFEHTRVLNEREIQVTLLHPDPAFLEWCSLPPFAPIRQDMIDFYEKKHSPLVPTLGAYQVSEYQREDHLMLLKNARFYGSTQTGIERVQIYLMKDELAVLPLLKSGKIELLTRVPVLQLEEIKKISTVVNVPVAATTYLGLNTRKAPFSDQKVRQRFRSLLMGEGEALAKTLKTGEIAALTYIPDVLFPADLHPQIEKMKKLSETFQVTIQSDAGSRNQTILEFIQGVTQEKLGWSVKLNLLEWKEHLSTMKVLGGVASSDAYRIGWQNPVRSPYVFYQVFKSTSPNNYTGWKSAEYDALVERLRVLSSNPAEKKEQKKIVNQLEEILRKEAPIVPLLHQVLMFSYSKRVLGFHANPFGVILFRELRLAQ